MARGCDIVNLFLAVAVRQHLQPRLEPKKMSGNAKHSSLLWKSAKLTVFMTSVPGLKFILVGF
jgi:hypothetical protein